MRNLKRALSLALSSVMLLGMMVVGTSAASYPDVDAQDNLEAIEVLQMLGVMSGDENGKFNPDAKVTRNEMAVIMTHLLQLNAGGTSPFTDVPAWAQPYVAACYANGVTSGTSATTYSGSNNVTAVEAALMVMKALGYFGYQGEFGDNWTVAVVKQATKIDLFNKVDAAATATITRSEAAQICLNALQSTVMVVTEEGGLAVDGNGISVNVKPTYDYQEAKNVSGKDYRTTGGDSWQQLVEKLYADTVKKDVSTNTKDDFGRPANKWSYGTASVTAPKAPAATFTAEVKGKEIYTAIGKINLENSEITYIVDNYETTLDSDFAINGNNAEKIGGNGVLTEVYVNEDKTAATIVEINTYVSKVTDCEENNDNGYDVTIEDESVKFDSFNAFEDDTVVLYTVSKNDNNQVAKIMSLATAEKVTGTVTRKTTNTSFVMDGTTYKYSAMASNTSKGKVVVDSQADIYLDTYGYVILVDDVAASEDYAVVLATTDGGWQGNTEYKARLLLADGTIVEVPAKVKTGTVPALLNNLVTYTKNSDGEYTLTKVSDSDLSNNVSSDLKFQSGKATATVAGTNYTANAKTVFFFYNSKDKEYNAYIGMKNVPNVDNGSSAYKYTVDVENGVLKAVYIVSEVDMMESSSTAATFFYVKGDEKVVEDSKLGNYYELKAVVDGEITTVNVTVDVYAELGGSAIASKVKTNSDGIITGVTKESNDVSLDANGDGYVIGTYDVKAAEDDIITINSKGYSYADGVKVFEYNTNDGKFIQRTIGSLKDGSYNIFVQIDDSTVVGIYYVK